MENNTQYEINDKHEYIVSQYCPPEFGAACAAFEVGKAAER